MKQIERSAEYAAEGHDWSIPRPGHNQSLESSRAPLRNRKSVQKGGYTQNYDFMSKQIVNEESGSCKSLLIQESKEPAKH